MQARQAQPWPENGPNLQNFDFCYTAILTHECHQLSEADKLKPTNDSTHHENLVTCCNNAGLSVPQTCPPPDNMVPLNDLKRVKDGIIFQKLDFAGSALFRASAPALQSSLPPTSTSESTSGALVSLENPSDHASAVKPRHLSATSPCLAQQPAPTAKPLGSHFILRKQTIYSSACTEGLNNVRSRASTLHSALKARNEGLLAAHTEAKKAWKAARAKAQRERLEALKSDDLEGYLRLVQTTKSAQIDRLLGQTDACLRQLAARLQARCTSAAADVASSSATPHQETTGGFSALQQSTEAWNSLAFSAVDIVSQPALLTGGELRDYQMQGLRWMAGLRNKGLNGILADEMGLGKTIQVIALVAHCLGSSAGNSAPKKPFLIAAPASVLPNWEKEFATWAPSVKVVSYRGSADVREQVFNREMRKAPGSTAKQPQYSFDVALTTYEYLMGSNDRPRLSKIPWNYIVIDEGHRLKNSGCKLNAELAHYCADHRLLLTGTPLQNSIDELWSLLNFLMPDLFNSADDFQTWFGGAMRRGGVDAAGNASDGEDSDAEDDAQYALMLSEEEVLIVTSRLHQVLRPFMLRRLKETVAGELPAKVEHLLPCRPAPYQTALFQSLKDQLEGPGGIRGVSNALMEMRNICNHPLISKLHPENAESSLPLHPLPAEVRLCGKMELLDRILLKLKASGHRVLIFCTMTRLLDILEDYLDWRGLGYLRLDGGTGSAERGALVEEFNAPESKAFAFLLSVRAGGVGLNLQAADTVIFYDTDWNPQMDAQAAARAHRIGQKNDVLVLRLQTAGTVEERVTAVAADKRGMADRSITGGFFDGKTSAAERQMYLLKLLKNQDGTGVAGGSGELSNAELNRLLARTDEELQLFEKEDKRLAGAESAAFKRTNSNDVNKSNGKYSRLASEQEVAPLVSAVLDLLRPKDPDEGKEFGRGKRARVEVLYKVK